MDIDDFKNTLNAGQPPDGIGPCLQALWLTAKDDWDGAHRIVQDQKSAEAAWVHAHLHRVEGDLANAGYWYRRAGRAQSSDDLPTEWSRIVGELLPANH